MTSSLLLIKVSATDIFPDPVFLSLCNIWLFASYLDRERGKLRHPAPGCFLSHYFRKLTTRFHIFYFLSLLMQCNTMYMPDSGNGKLEHWVPSVRVFSFCLVTVAAPVCMSSLSYILQIIWGKASKNPWFFRTMYSINPPPLIRYN